MHFNISESINWSSIMDWVVFCSCLVLLTGVIIDIIKSVKSNKELSNEHKAIKESQKDLSSDNEKIKDLIRSENKDTQQVIIKGNSELYHIINNVDKMLIKEIEGSKYKYENLTDEQRNIKNYVESINNLMKEVERLQTLSIEQQKQIIELQSELNQAQQFNNNFTQHM